MFLSLRMKLHLQFVAIAIWSEMNEMSMSVGDGCRPLIPNCYKWQVHDPNWSSCSPYTVRVPGPIAPCFSWVLHVSLCKRIMCENRKEKAIFRDEIIRSVQIMGKINMK